MNNLEFIRMAFCQSRNSALDFGNGLEAEIFPPTRFIRDWAFVLIHHDTFIGFRRFGTMAECCDALCACVREVQNSLDPMSQI